MLKWPSFLSLLPNLPGRDPWRLQQQVQTVLLNSGFFDGGNSHESQAGSVLYLATVLLLSQHFPLIPGTEQEGKVLLSVAIIAVIGFRRLVSQGVSNWTQKQPVDHVQTDQAHLRKVKSLPFQVRQVTQHINF